MAEILTIPTENPDIYLQRLVDTDAGELLRMVEDSAGLLRPFAEGFVDRVADIVSARVYITAWQERGRLVMGIRNAARILVGCVTSLPVNNEIVKVGYVSHAAHAGQGNVKVALRAMTTYVLSQGYGRVEAHIDDRNLASIGVANTLALCLPSVLTKTD